MNCSQCGSSIDYRFTLTCLNCDCELIAATNESQPLLPTKHEPKAQLKFRHHLLNLIITIASAFVGVVVCAPVTLVFGGWVYRLIYWNEVHDSYSCSRGNAIGFLLLLLGAILGLMTGTIFSYENRIYK
jgi:hypothetical protein